MSQAQEGETIQAFLRHGWSKVVLYKLQSRKRHASLSKLVTRPTGRRKIINSVSSAISYLQNSSQSVTRWQSHMYNRFWHSVSSSQSDTSTDKNNVNSALKSVFNIIKLKFLIVALCNRADHYIFMLWFVLSSFFLLSFFSSPNLSGRRLDVYHTLAHGVALVRI